jgi:hypothetical protein
MANGDVTERRKVEILGDWVTWAVRGVTVAIAWMMWQQVQQLQQVEVQLATIAAKVDSHTEQLLRLWQDMSQRHP